MARVKRGVVARRRHKKIIRQAKGYYNARRKVFRVAKQAVTKALQYAYIGRKLKKRQFRSLWIARINAAARLYGLSYSRFINGLQKGGVTLDRKVLADIAVHDLAGFGELAEVAGKALGIEVVKPATLPRYHLQDTRKPPRGSKRPAAATEPPNTDGKAKAQPGGRRTKPKGDDLKKIEGIGPKIAEVFVAAGIDSFAKLAATEVERLKTILEQAGPQFASHDPSTWPQQAKLAAEGKFDELKALQDQLQGGRAG